MTVLCVQLFRASGPIPWSRPNPRFLNISPSDTHRAIPNKAPPSISMTDKVEIFVKDAIDGAEKQTKNSQSTDSGSDIGPQFHPFKMVLAYNWSFQRMGEECPSSVFRAHQINEFGGVTFQ